MANMTPQQIRQLRDRLQMTQEEFAKHLGFRTKGAVSRLESGQRPPTGVLRAFLQHLATHICYHRPGK